ncbi:MAG: TIGR03905 family TSCPD domain-containing protein [Treponema sp.]|nr:TIGR03905 family TSCPD domain-containing protein [Treponema sp.]
MYEFKTDGTCSSKIQFEIKDGKVYSVSFEKGCTGNLKALGILIEGMDAAEVVQKLKGLKCGAKNTSCGDQLAVAIEQYLA